MGPAGCGAWSEWRCVKIGFDSTFL